MIGLIVPAGLVALAIAATRKRPGAAAGTVQAFDGSGGAGPDGHDWRTVANPARQITELYDGQEYVVGFNAQRRIVVWGSTATDEQIRDAKVVFGLKRWDE